MGIFSTSSPFDDQLDKATNELNTETDWGLIMSLCDKIKTTPKGPVEFANVIMPKLTHKIPHVSMQAITVLDCCVNNCGKDFHKVVSSQGFMDGLRDILYHYKNPKVTRRLRYFIKKWAEDFKEDPELSHFVSFYYDLRGEKMEFPDAEDDVPESKNKAVVSKDPNVVSSQQEADDIAKAIEESLKEEKQRKTGTQAISSVPTSSLYPSVLGGSTATSAFSSGASYASSGQSAKRIVKALYDFEAAEDNELTFKAGDLITIVDDSDANWWKGEGSNGSGLFPSNFVTPDLTTEPEPEVAPQAKEEEEEHESVVKFNETVEVKEVDQEKPVLEINEVIIDETLATLQSTDPETTTTDPPKLLQDEDTCMQMGKLIDGKLEEIDRKHLELTLLNEKILDSLKMYDDLMKDMPVYMPAQYGLPQGQMPPNMMGGYGTYPASSFMPPTGAPGPSSGIPQHMAASQMSQTPQMYNPMYQAPGFAYPAPNNVTTTDGTKQQPVMPQNTYNASAPQPQTTAMSNIYPGQPNPGFSPMTTQYQNQPVMPGNSTPAFQANHVASQPLM
ncbi:unnamed protein product [Clavelina lepadiformis]|uniref:Signal transducing adapter molecule 1 n=1 Tax=Clavelina lepadiformis TaxID=159417 RepID=A0ABP0EWN2_CLALP